MNNAGKTVAARAGCNATGLDVKLAEGPPICVARGTAVWIENLDLWKDTMESDADEI